MNREQPVKCLTWSEIRTSMPTLYCHQCIAVARRKYTTATPSQSHTGEFGELKTGGGQYFYNNKLRTIWSCVPVIAATSLARSWARGPTMAQLNSSTRMHWIPLWPPRGTYWLSAVTNFGLVQWPQKHVHVSLRCSYRYLFVSIAHFVDDAYKRRVASGHERSYLNEPRH